MKYIYTLLTKGGYKKYKGRILFSTSPFTEYLGNSRNFKYHLQGFHVLQDKTDVDFHLDAISGRRVGGLMPSKLIKFRNVPNFDIKFIWDVSRFQFMSEVLDAYGINEVSKDIFLRNLKSFRSSNRPYFGPNWMCTMDVAIRGVNIVYYCEALGSNLAFSASEQSTISEILHNHYRFIYANLEWKKEGRGNHYLSNLCGLIILGGTLQMDEQDSKKFEFAVNEFIKEVRLQFLQDGAYFENSTAYHRLALEMVFYTLKYMHAYDLKSNGHLLSCVNFEQLGYAPLSFKNLIDREFSEMLGKAAIFCNSITLDDGSFIQIGDNDSGRFIIRDAIYMESFKGHFRNDNISLSNYTIVQEIQSSTFACKEDSLRTNSFLHSQVTTNDREFTEVGCTSFETEVMTQPEVSIFPNFGLIVWKSGNTSISFRCGYSHIKMSHAHEDQLSITIRSSRKFLLFDKGSYTYNRSQKERTRYQSSEAHFVPYFKDLRQGNQLSTFQFSYNGHFELLRYDAYGAVGRWNVKNRSIIREISLLVGKVIVTDFVNSPYADLYEVTPIGRIDLIPNSLEYGTCN